MGNRNAGIHTQQSFTKPSRSQSSARGVQWRRQSQVVPGWRLGLGGQQHGRRPPAPAGQQLLEWMGVGADEQVGASGAGAAADLRAPSATLHACMHARQCQCQRQCVCEAGMVRHSANARLLLTCMHPRATPPPCTLARLHACMHAHPPFWPSSTHPIPPHVAHAASWAGRTWISSTRRTGRRRRARRAARTMRASTRT